MNEKDVPFNRPYTVGTELDYIAEAIRLGQLAGDGHFTKECSRWLEDAVGCRRALLTHSCTAALEMAAILADLEPGDEVIMPSYTFVSTANAFVLRGGVPVFVDIQIDTLNIDERQIEAAITPRTKAIVPVHYAGVACAMDAIQCIAEEHDLLVIEDAAHAFSSTFRRKPLGSFGQLAAFSFHETKNIISGEGGCLLVNDERFSERATVVREKGTNRSQFFRGLVDKYTWVDVGSSYLPGELTAAFLLAQLERSGEVLGKRMDIWERYHAAFAPLEASGRVRRPHIPAECEHNGHMYYLLFTDLVSRTRAIDYLQTLNINSVFHYVPLHSSPAGRKFCRTSGDLRVTDRVADTLLRLPLWAGMTAEMIERVIAGIYESVSGSRGTAGSAWPQVALHADPRATDILSKTRDVVDES